MSNIARSSAWMALGTIFSRLSGFIRGTLILAILGATLNGSLFSLANTLPNSVYILVAGGVFNVVLVPQMVRAMRHDADHGQAYVDRVITLGVIVLGTATLLLMAAAPLLIDPLTRFKLTGAEFADQRSDAIWLMVLCMPQVFFYGVFVLVGQILNARERFGPMMWAPIVNNVVAVAMLLMYWVVFGRTAGSDGFTVPEMVLIAGGSTLGIAIQAATLVPYLRQVDYRWHPRFDFRGVGLSHTFKLGGWTLGFIVVNQLAFFNVVALAQAAAIDGASGQTLYDYGFQISQLPHGVITVSLATAIIPTLSAFAADDRLGDLRDSLTETIRMAAVLIVPLATATAVLGHRLGDLIGTFSASGPSRSYGTTITAFSLSMLMFTLHYLVIRGFYAMEDTRTPFFIQSAIAGTNIVLATVLARLVAETWVTTMLALAIGSAYTVGLALSTTTLSRRIGSIVDATMRRFIARVAVASAAMALVLFAGDALWRHVAGPVAGALPLLLGTTVIGITGLAVYAALAHAMRIRELQLVVGAVRRR